MANFTYHGNYIEKKTEGNGLSHYASKDKTITEEIRERLLIGLRKKYKTASNEERKKIVIEAEQIKNAIACYTCKNNLVIRENDLFPFCSQECHKIWKEENPLERSFKTASIAEMQKRIREYMQGKAEMKTDINKYK